MAAISKGLKCPPSLVALTCHPDGVVAEQRVAVGEPARVDARVLVRHVDDAQHPLAQPRPVARHQPSAVFEPDDGLWVVFQVTRHFQGVPNAQNIVHQEGCLAGHGVCRQREDKVGYENGVLFSAFVKTQPTWQTNRPINNEISSNLVIKHHNIEGKQGRMGDVC